MRFSFRLLASAALLFATTLTAAATTTPARIAQSNRIAANANFGPQTQLTGHIPAWVRPENQVAEAVDLSGTMHLSIVLRRDPAVQAAFEQFLAQQQQPGSPYYHQWLTPAQIGELYGPTAPDVAAVASWLTSQGLNVDSVAPSRAIVEVSGSAANVAAAFHTSFGYFNLGGAPRLSAIAEPSIPTALVSVIDVIHGLTEVPLAPQNHRSAEQGGKYSTPSGTAIPQLTATDQNNNEYNFVTPNDFAVLYDIGSVYSGGNTGATIAGKAQHVAIIGRSRVSSSDISTYATNTAIPSYNFNTIIPTTGTDPGITNNGDQDEATLDVDRIIGTAYGVQADLLVSASSRTYDGIYIASAYNVNTLMDPIMTISFGACEASAGASGVNLYNTLFSSAAAEGISVFVSSDDSGAAGCDTSFANPPTTQQRSINYICSSTYATCVGGTEFADVGKQSTYWSATNGTGYESVLSYIPEGAWNEPTTADTTSGYEPAASGGGASVYITKPSYQTGTGVPADNARDVPDVAFDAASHDGYYACLDYALKSGESCAKGYFFDFSGTSAAAPSMAGIAALINTKLGVAQGNLNPLLYKTATASPAAFHDVTVATSGVTNCTTATPSMCNNSTPGPSSLTGGEAGYAVTAGYDQATGLGSIDVANFLSAISIGTTASVTSVSANPTSGPVNSSIALTATVTGTGGTPTGTVQFYSNNVAIGAAQTLTAGSVTLNYTFTTAGIYNITAIYSGDATFASSTSSPAAIVTITNGPTFTVTPTSTSLNYVSNANTGVTDSITVTSLNGFAGTVALTCAVTSGIGTCSLAPPAVALTSGSSAGSVLTINTAIGYKGTLTVTVTGTSNTTVVTSSTITVAVTAPFFTTTTNPTSLSLISGATTGNTSAITVTSSNSFAGTVTLTCGTQTVSGTAAGTCSISPSTVTLGANGTASGMLTVASALGSSGSLVVNIMATGTTTGASVAVTSMASVSVALTGASVLLAPATSALTFTSGATTGNTNTINVTSTNGFAGNVTLGCNIAPTSGNPAYPATCAISPTVVMLTAGGTASAVVTITSTVAQGNRQPVSMAGLGSSVGAMALLLCLLPFRRRRGFRPLAALLVLFGGLAMLSGCGGGGTVAPAKRSSAGTYTVTVTGSGTTNGATIASTIAPATFTVNIN